MNVFIMPPTATQFAPNTVCDALSVSVRWIAVLVQNAREHRAQLLTAFSCLIHSKVTLACIADLHPFIAAGQMGREIFR